MAHWVAHPHVRSGDQLKFGERAADVLKMSMGTWTALGLIVAVIIFWLGFVRDPGELHLNLALSFLASVQGVVLQIAANRGDRISSEVAAGTHENSARLLAMQETLLGLQQQQMGLLDELRAVKAAARKTGAV